MSAETFRQTIERPSDRVIVALDNMGWPEAETVMEEVSSYVGLAKANSIAQKRGWKHAAETIGLRGLHTMVDQKYKDIPSTMQNHLREVTECNPILVTIHADNTLEAMTSAVEGRDEGRGILNELYDDQRGWIKHRAKILGVTVLTSYGLEDSISIYGGTPEKKVLQFAETALEAGLDGIVCSGKELEAIRSDEVFNSLLAVVPGITPQWAKKAGDQKRVITPSEAVQKGADYIVVGRAITKPPEGVSRAEAAQRIAVELEEAL